jgi:hypothetical protein
VESSVVKRSMASYGASTIDPGCCSSCNWWCRDPFPLAAVLQRTREDCCKEASSRPVFFFLPIARTPSCRQRGIIRTAMATTIKETPCQQRRYQAGESLGTPPVSGHIVAGISRIPLIGPDARSTQNWMPAGNGLQPPCDRASWQGGSQNLSVCLAFSVFSGPIETGASFSKEPPSDMQEQAGFSRHSFPFFQFLSREHCSPRSSSRSISRRTSESICP